MRTKALVMSWSLIAVLTCFGREIAANPERPPNLNDFVAFQRALEQLAQVKNLPGLSAAIVRDRKVAWTHGFGFADVENEVPAYPGTPYRLASLSKPFAAVLLLQLVEEKRLDLDARMEEFAIHPWFEPGGGSWAHYPKRYADSPIRVRHVLTHTSQSEPPGEAYAYSGNIFADLTWVIEHVSGKSYPTLLQERILEPLKMQRTLPGELVPWNQEVAADLARPYKIPSGKPVPGTYPGFSLDPDVDVGPWNLKPAYRLPKPTQEARRAQLQDAFTPLYSSQAAAGMISTVEDLARFDIALDNHVLLSKNSLHHMFTPASTSDGTVLPYGLGWFIEESDGLRIVWHYGWFPPTVSSLYIKLPQHDLTFLLLSNCDGLSANVPWSREGVRGSPFARMFLEHFLPQR